MGDVVQMYLFPSVLVIVLAVGVIVMLGCMLWALSMFWFALMGDFIERKRQITDWRRRMEEEEE